MNDKNPDTSRSRKWLWIIPVAIAITAFVVIVLAAEGYLGEFNYGLN